LNCFAASIGKIIKPRSTPQTETKNGDADNRFDFDIVHFLIQKNVQKKTLTHAFKNENDLNWPIVNRKGKLFGKFIGV
jgi:hypothetical protein